jgi:hypothetical protein
MSAELQIELEAAILSDMSLEEIVALLRQFKDKGVSRGEMCATLEALREKAPNEAIEDRILEVADFAAGFCSPHMRVWTN